MLKTYIPFLLAIPIVLAAVALGAVQPPAATPDLERLRAMTARFAPVDIGTDLASLAPGERTALVHLVRAAQLMDAIFLKQVWAGNQSLLLDLHTDDTPLGRARIHYFLINKGPWSRLDHHEIFVPGAPAKPASANYLSSRGYQDGGASLDGLIAGR